ncbi:hypothetical protein, partial [Streptomyces zhihengii]
MCARGWTGLWGAENPSRAGPARADCRGGACVDGDDELDPDDEGFEDAANYAMAASAVTAGCE